MEDWSDEELWKTYIQLTEAEAAFQIHRIDLSLRPIWHQKQERVQAHILVCFLAYVLWKTLAAFCQRAGLGDEPRRVLKELEEIRVVDVVLPTRKGIEIKNAASPNRANIKTFCSTNWDSICQHKESKSKCSENFEGLGVA